MSAAPPPHLERFRPNCAQDWEERRPQIAQYYLTENRKLDEVKEIMKTEHNFSATTKQYKDHIKQWKLDKNIKTAEMRTIVQIQSRRRVIEDKDTGFVLRNRPVPQEKIDGFIKRQAEKRDEIAYNPEDPPTTPSNLSYYTPPAWNTDEEAESSNEVRPRQPAQHQLAVRSRERARVRQVMVQHRASLHHELHVPVYSEITTDSSRRFLVSQYCNFLAPALAYRENFDVPVPHMAHLLPLASDCEPILNCVYSLASASLEYRGIVSAYKPLSFHHEAIHGLQKLVEHHYPDRNKTLAAVLLLLYYQTMFNPGTVYASIHLKQAMDVLAHFSQWDYTDPTSKFIEETFKFYDFSASLSLGATPSFPPPLPAMPSEDGDSPDFISQTTVFGLSSSLVPTLYELARLKPRKQDLTTFRESGPGPERAYLQGIFDESRNRTKQELISWEMSLPSGLSMEDLEIEQPTTEEKCKLKMILHKSQAYRHSAFIYLYHAVDGLPTYDEHVIYHVKQSLAHCSKAINMECPMVPLLWPLTVSAHQATRPEDQTLARELFRKMEGRQGGVVVQRMRIRIEGTWILGLVDKKCGENEDEETELRQRLEADAERTSSARELGH